jgi:hypothetical protein
MEAAPPPAAARAIGVGDGGLWSHYIPEVTPR